MARLRVGRCVLPVRLLAAALVVSVALSAPAEEAQPATDAAAADAAVADGQPTDAPATDAAAPDAPVDATAADVESTPTPTPTPSPTSSPPTLTLQRVREELASALAGMGVPSQANRAETAARLERIAHDSAALAGRLLEPQARLEARSLEMQAYNALAQQAQQRHEPADATYRVGQMRSAAYGVKAIEAPNAGTVGDFWLLQADLIDLNRAVKDEDLRQKQAIERLERFVRDQEADGPPRGDAPADGPVTEVKLSLLQLYDQRGQSDKLVALIKQLRASSATDALRRRLDRDYGYADVIGQPFEARLRLADGSTWSSADHAGKVMLLGFSAGWFEPSVDEVNRVMTEAVELGAGELALLHVDVTGARRQSSTEGAGADAPGESADAAEASDDAAAATTSAAEADASPARRWPVYRQGPGQVNLSRMFSVRTLPRFVLIDARGRVVAIGGSRAMLERVKALSPDEAERPRDAGDDE